MYILRKYQQEAVDASYKFLTESKRKGGLIVAPTGSGKSLIIGTLAKLLKENTNHKTLVIQSSKEILIQNYEKFTSYGYTAGIYSASIGRKDLDDVVFSTIGSVKDKYYQLKDYHFVIIDECHTVNSDKGMYENFFEMSRRIGSEKKILGLTASPFRLSTKSWGSVLKLLTRTRPRILDTLVYSINSEILVDEGFIHPINYYSLPVVYRKQLSVNSSGSEYDDKSLMSAYAEIGHNDQIVAIADRLLNNVKKPELSRKNLLIFVRFIEDAEYIASKIGAVVISSETPKKLRDEYVLGFKQGNIKCVVNCLVLGTGFDFPQLETVLFARSTMSLNIWYQCVGRLSRVHKDKEDAWLIDCGDNLGLFGKIEDLRFVPKENGTHYMSGLVNGIRKQLTNVLLSKD